MLLKIHKAYRTIVAICDSDLYGEKFEDGKLQIDLTGSFFNGEEKTEAEIEAILQDFAREDAIFNIVGKNACRIAKRLNLIEESGILYIKNIPVALALL